MVEFFNGDVVKFCGDALIVVWPIDVNATDSEKCAVISLATKCAVTFVSSPRLANVLNLKLHCGISAGIIHCMHLGNKRQMEFVVSGDAIEECGLAASEASLGEVCWSPIAYSIVQHKYTGQRKPMGNMLLTEYICYDINCAECTIYAGLCCSSPMRPPSNKRSSPQVIRGRTSSSSWRNGDTMMADSPPAGSNSPLRSPSLSCSNSLDYSLSPRAAELLMTKSSPEKPNRVELPRMDPDISSMSARARHACGSNSPSCRFISAGSSPGSLSKYSAGGSPQTKSMSTPSPPTCQSDSTTSFVHPPGESLGSERSVSSDSASQVLTDGEQWTSARKRGKSLLDNIAESLEKVKSNFSSNESSSSVDENSYERSPHRLRAVKVTGRIRSASAVDNPPVGGSPPPVQHRHSAASKLTSPLSGSRTPPDSSPHGNAKLPMPRILTVPSDISVVDEAHRMLHVEENHHEAAVKAFLSPFLAPSSHKFSDQSGKTSGPGSDDGKLMYDENEHLKASLYRLFVPAMAHQLVEEDGLASLAEMRRVTTMFIEILNATGDFSRGHVAKPQKALKTILSCLSRFGGFLRQYVIDDKGCVAIVGFGVPGYCHDDNSARAIESAVYIRRHLQAGGLGSRIGIAVGHVYCGLVGSSYRCEYAMMGASVNLAARLMGKCMPEQILVAEQVRMDTIKLFSFEELPRVKAKGYKLPIAVFTPVGRNTGRSAIIGNYYDIANVPNVFVGRAAELDMFETMLSNLAREKKRPSAQVAHVIEGPPGMGKSWLAGEVKCMASKYTNISCCSATAAAPTAFDLMKYDVIGQLLEQLLGLPAHIGENLSSRRLLGNADDMQCASYHSHSTDSRSPLPSRTSSMFMSPRLDSCDKVEDPHKVISELNQQFGLMVHLSDWLYENVDEDFYLRVQRSNPKKEKHIRKLSSSDALAAFDVMRAAAAEDSDDEENDDSFRADTSPDVARNHELTLRAVDAMSLLNSVLPVKFAVSDAVAALSPEERTKFREALLLLILTCCIEKTPTLLIVSRIHWCDVPSLRVLRQVLIDAKPAFLCTMDPSVALSDKIDVAQGNPVVGIDLDPLPKILSTCQKHVLQPLSPDEIETLLKGIMGQGVLDREPSILSESSIQDIAARTAGNPFLVASLSIRIRDAITANSFKGICSVTYGRCDQSIKNFDTLSRDAQFVLKAASIIGMSFSELDLVRLSPELNFSAAMLDLPQILAELQSREFIGAEESASALCLAADDRRNNNVFRFLSSAVYENVNQLILEQHKEEAHGSYAKILEPYLETSPELLDIVIEHYAKSDLSSKKVEFFGRGLEFAKTIYSCALVKKYTQELVVLSVGCRIPELMQFCCTPKAIQKKEEHPDHNNPFLFLRKMKQNGSAKLPVYVRVSNVWLSAADFVTPVPCETDADYMAGYIALTSAVQFRMGSFRTSFNTSLLAMHCYRILNVISYKSSSGVMKWMFTGTKQDSVSVFLKNAKFSRLRELGLSSLRLVVALCVQLGVVSLLCARTKTAKFYFELSATLRMFTEKRFPQHSFFVDETPGGNAGSPCGFPIDYILSLHRMKDLLVNLCVCSDSQRGRAHIDRGAISSNASSLKTDHESHSPEWDLNDSMDDCSATLTRARTASSNTELDYMIDSKFVMDAASHISSGLAETGSGHFAVAYATFGWGIHLLNIDTDDFGATCRQMIILQNAWVALLSGNVERSKVICSSVLEYTRAYKQVLLCKWALELDMLHQILGADFSVYSITSAIEHCAYEIKKRTRTDKMSPCSSAILALSYVMDRDAKRALPLVKYAVAKLCNRPAVTIVPGIFLFIAGYAAALLMQHDNAYRRNLPSNISLEHRNLSPRVFNVCKDVVAQALSGLSSMAAIAQPCLTLLHDALEFKYITVVFEGASIVQHSKNFFLDTSLTKYNEFIFGKAFVHLERFNFICNSGVGAEELIHRQHDVKAAAEFYFRKLACPSSSIMFFSGSKLCPMKPHLDESIGSFNYSNSDRGSESGHSPPILCVTGDSSSPRGSSHASNRFKDRPGLNLGAEIAGSDVSQSPSNRAMGSRDSSNMNISEDLDISPKSTISAITPKPNGATSFFKDSP